MHEIVQQSDEVKHSKIHLYAEHLLNIRTLTLQASLATLSNKETEALFSAEGNVLSLNHEGETARIELPVTVPGKRNNVTLTLPAVPTKDISFRLEIEEKPESNWLSHGTSDDENVTPWTARDLTAETEIGCRSCNAILVERGQIQQWKDLPSEGWAEMMDFWHCHKPDVPHRHDQAGSIKGYAANSQLALESGVGMVDPRDFLLVKPDCHNIKVGILSAFITFSFILNVTFTAKRNRLFQALRSLDERVGIRLAQIKPLREKLALPSRKRWVVSWTLGANVWRFTVMSRSLWTSTGLKTRYMPNYKEFSNSAKLRCSLHGHVLTSRRKQESTNTSDDRAHRSLICSSCDGILGRVDSQSEALRLRKPYLSLSPGPLTPHGSHDLEKWFSCLLLTAIECQGVRKFNVRVPADKSLNFRIWVFSPDLNVSSSSAGNGGRPLRVVKVLLREDGVPIEDLRINSQTLSEGDLELSPKEAVDLKRLIVQSSSLLPEQARMFQDWKVGLLRRFTASDLPA